MESSNIKAVDKYLQERGYDTSKRVADHREASAYQPPKARPTPFPTAQVALYGSLFIIIVLLSAVLVQVSTKGNK